MGNQVTDLVLTTKQSNKIKRALKALEDVRKEIDLQSDVDGGINWYIEDSNNLYLMDGYAHDERCYANQGMAIKHFILPQSSGGGW